MRELGEGEDFGRSKGLLSFVIRVIAKQSCDTSVIQIFGAKIFQTNGYRFFGKSEWVSQCVCLKDEDCAKGFYCDPVKLRCLADLCRADALNEVGKKCKESYVCDPYTGRCVNPAIEPVTSCIADDQCGAPGYICNTEGGLCTGSSDCSQHIGFCVKAPGAVLDCLSQCHPLLARCIECIADCECEKAKKGNFCGDYSCKECNISKIGFDQGNPAQFDLCEVRLSKAGWDAGLQVA